MIIENMQQTIDLLNNIKDFFYNIEEIEKKLITELHNKEGERDDLLHEIELSDLNIGERASTYKKLKKVLTHVEKCDILIQNAAEDSRCRKA